jgi:hypothetical protein
MLRRILGTIPQAGRPLCPADLRRALDVDPDVLAGMLDTLVALGRLRPVSSGIPDCAGCPIRGGCFVMRDTSTQLYELPTTGPRDGRPASEPTC